MEEHELAEGPGVKAFGPASYLEEGRMSIKIAKAPPDMGRLELGRTIPSLLDQVVKSHPNERAFNQRDGAGGWRTWSNAEFARQAEALALGLRGAGLQAGDRVALFTESDMSFVLGDMGSLIGGLVDVPVYLTHTENAIRHILSESGSRAVLVTDRALLERMARLAADLPSVQLLAVFDPAALEGFEPGPEWSGRRVTSFDALQAEGNEIRAREPDRVERYKRELVATELATIIYTSGTTGTPKGVMLSHQNLTSNAIASITGLPQFEQGAGEVVLSFLPLSHIFARTLQYANMWYGSSIHYGTPDTVREDLAEVRPTFMAAVPRVLEKSWERMQAAGDELTGLKRTLYQRALRFAEGYDVNAPPNGLAGMERRVLDRLVYSKWRDALGGRLKMIIVGGAALRPELVNILGAADIEVLQGFGLTETSPVMTFNRPGMNRPGTVGVAIEGTEVGISDEGEILARGPHVMLGYFQREDETAEAIDEGGWFHTGDLGRLDDDGYLSVTGRLKYLFKLSTGKYVMPQPLTDRLEANALIDTAIVVGGGQKYCTALLFLNHDVLLERFGRIDPSVLKEPKLEEELKHAIAAANDDMPHWSTVKRAAVVADQLTMEDGSVTPKLSVKREVVVERYQDVLNGLYAERGAPEGALYVSLD